MLQSSPFVVQLSNGKGTTTLTEEQLKIDGRIVHVTVNGDGTRTFAYRDRTITLSELKPHDKGGEGSACWLSSIAFFATIDNYEFLSALDSKSFDATVLELGCGTGLGGITAAMYSNCGRVIMMDSDKKLMPVVNKNIQRNVTRDPKRTYFVDISYESLKGEHLKFDTVLALDCIYKSNNNNVADAIVDNLFPKGQAIIINPMRYGVDSFLYMLMEKGTVSSSTIRVEYGAESLDLGLYIFTKGNVA